MTPAQYKWARGRLGLTHREIAAVLGICERTSQRHETGATAVGIAEEKLLIFLTTHPGDLASLQRRMLDPPNWFHVE
jgi:DNA-binding transcriptional regulator YiaG